MAALCVIFDVNRCVICGRCVTDIGYQEARKVSLLSLFTLATLTQSTLYVSCRNLLIHNVISVQLISY